MKIKRVLLLSLAAFATACSSPQNNRIDEINDYVDNVEMECSSYSDADWTEVDAEFERLRQDIEDNYETMTREEQQEALKAIGRYYGLMTRRGIDRAQRNLENLPSLIEGFKEVFDE